jgi:hypothetical protein
MKKPKALTDLQIGAFVLAFAVSFFVTFDVGFIHYAAGITAVFLLMLWPSELVISFNEPMAPRISIGTPCSEGVCYKNAFWRDSKTLVIKVDPSLRSNHDYKITIGYKRLLESASGISMPLLTWTFHTV